MKIIQSLSDPNLNNLKFINNSEANQYRYNKFNIQNCTSVLRRHQIRYVYKSMRNVDLSFFDLDIEQSIPREIFLQHFYVNVSY